MTTTLKKTDTVVVPVMAYMNNKYIEIKNSFVAKVTFVTEFLRSIFSFCMEISYIPFKLFSLWNKGYSIKPIFVLNGFKTKTKRQRLGGSAFAYDFKNPGNHYRSFIYFDLFKGGFVIKKPTSTAGYYRNYDEYKYYGNDAVVKAIWPTLHDLRKAYKIAIKSSKIVIEEERRMEVIKKLTQELDTVKVGDSIDIIGSGDSRDATGYKFKKTKDGFVSSYGWSGHNNWFDENATSKELAENMIERGFRIYKI
jgi:hypothetical protein